MFGFMSLILIMFQFISFNQSSSLLRRQVIPQPPAYIVLSDGYRPNYTLLKLAKRSPSALVTDGPADGYNATLLPPPPALRGEFRVVDDNLFAPQNRGVRRYFETWVIGVIAVGEKCLKASLDAPYLKLASCQNGTLTDKSYASHQALNNQDHLSLGIKPH